MDGVIYSKWLIIPVIFWHLDWLYDWSIIPHFRHKDRECDWFRIPPLWQWNWECDWSLIPLLWQWDSSYDWLIVPCDIDTDHDNNCGSLDAVTMVMKILLSYQAIIRRAPRTQLKVEIVWVQSPTMLCRYDHHPVNVWYPAGSLRSTTVQINNKKVIHMPVSYVVSLLQYW